MSVYRVNNPQAVALGQEISEPRILGEVDFSLPHLVNKNIDITTGDGVFFNYHYRYSWIMHNPGQSDITARMNIEKDPSKTYTLDLNHLSSLVDGRPLSSITIHVNDSVLTTGYNPDKNNGGYFHDLFDITDYVRNGQNSIVISLDWRAFSNYWINSLTVTES